MAAPEDLQVAGHTEKYITGLEPWFDFWGKVRYAIEQTRIEYANWKAYQRNMGAN